MYFDHALFHCLNVLIVEYAFYMTVIVYTHCCICKTLSSK